MLTIYLSLLILSFLLAGVAGFLQHYHAGWAIVFALLAFAVGLGGLGGLLGALL